MKLRVLQSLGMTEGTINAGQIAEVDQDVAEDWLKAGFAEKAKKDDVPTFGVTAGKIQSIEKYTASKKAEAEARKAEEARAEQIRKAEAEAAEKAAAEAEKAEAEAKKAEAEAKKKAEAEAKKKGTLGT